MASYWPAAPELWHIVGLQSLSLEQVPSRFTSLPNQQVSDTHTLNERVTVIEKTGVATSNKLQVARRIQLVSQRVDTRQPFMASPCASVAHTDVAQVTNMG